MKQIAKDFGISFSCLTNWMRQAEIEAGNKPGTTKAEAEELRTARRRIRLLEQENEVLRRAGRTCRRRACRKNDVPARVRARRRRDPRGGVACGSSSSPASPTTGGSTIRVTTAEVEAAHRANALHHAHLNDPGVRVPAAAGRGPRRPGTHGCPHCLPGGSAARTGGTARSGPGGA
ncbi:hypothetical protein GS507_25180, partial [Rhodococcus hoagii]|nr:hypothetical protein [Prescottella equi]